MTSILSSGYGRLHFVQSASWLGKAGVVVKLVCGWVPQNPDSWVVRFCSKMVGRDLSAGMRKRAIELPSDGEVLPCAWADFMCQGMFLIEQKIFRGRLLSFFAAGAWKIFGWQSRKYIKEFGVRGRSVFHVRSGAGHGGAIQLARRLHIPVIVDHSIAHPAFMEEHLRCEYEKNGEVFNLGISSRFWRLVAEDCDWADLLLVNSHFVRDTFINQGYPNEKIKVVYLGTRPDFFGLRAVKAAPFAGRTIKLLFTGNFSFRKGAEYLIRAVKLLMERTSNPFELDVVGSYDEKMLNRFDARSLPITFHGPVPQDDLKRFLACSDIYVFPSLSEGCACSGMEAMAAGLCVVATHESGLPIEDGVNGCIVPGKSAEAIAEKISWLFGHLEEIDRIGAAAAELIKEKYTWEQYAENVKKIYEEAISE